jgi:hypothetical protein
MIDRPVAFVIFIIIILAIAAHFFALWREGKQKS